MNWPGLTRRPKLQIVPLAAPLRTLSPQIEDYEHT